MGNYNSINDAVRAKIDKLIEEKGLDKKDYLYTADVASSLNQLASIMGGSGDSMTIADSLYDVLDSADGAGGGGSGGGEDLVKLIDRTISMFSDSTITQIGDYAFYACSDLTTISCPNVISIGRSAFARCSSLQSISFPECTYIDENAFAGFYGSDSVIVGPVIEEAVFPKCTTLGLNAFAYCADLKEVNFPKLEEVKDNCFAGSPGIENVNIPSCRIVDSFAFANCELLSSIALPVCEVIYMSAFTGCSNLESLYLLSTSRVRVQNGMVYYDPFEHSKLSTTGHIYVRASLVDSYSEYSDFWNEYSSNIVGLTDEQIATLDNE